MGAHADAMVSPVLALLRDGAPDAWHRCEVPIGGAHADIALIRDGLLYAVELKSAADSLARLPNQLRGYARVAGRIVVACAPRHAAGVARVIREVGIAGVGVVAVDEIAPSWLVAPSQNSARDACHVAWSLHAKEVVSVLDARGSDCARGVRGKSLSFVVRRCEALGVTIDEYQAALVRCWPARDWDRWKREREAIAIARRARREREELDVVGEFGGAS